MKAIRDFLFFTIILGYFSSMISVVLLGAGNVGTHLYEAFSKAKNVNLLQWYNRSLDHIYAYQKNIDITDDLNDLVPADVYIIAVSDSSIGPLSKELPFKDRLVAHTSGSLNFRFMGAQNRRAVFYPLQTFSKQRAIDFSKVPICIESTNKSDLELLANLAQALNCNSFVIDTEQRQSIHLAAVYANNFVNQLYRIAHEITDNKGVDFDILKPLILETALKVQEMSPYMAQTGPAKRNDKKTIKQHIMLIENNQHKAVYQLLTDAIKKTHGIH
jgi:predicted short-subunit dehydrogenase-like oxidoreductase (DUF2520 family)